MSSARAGYLSCLCIGFPDADVVAGVRPSLVQLASGFALSALAQSLTASILPVAAWQLAPGKIFAAVPLALMFVGAILATFPASLLLDRFGRRAAFALGASLGIGGGLLVAFALVTRQFPILCLGALWLGSAQGFGLFYRHAAVIGGQPSSSAFVLGAGAAAGLIAPWLSRVAENLAEPYFIVGTALAAACVQVLALALAIVLREPPVQIARETVKTRSSFLLPVLIGGAVWFMMAAAMQKGPLSFLACTGSLGGATGLVAWHVLAMYASAIVVPPLVARTGWQWAAVPALAFAASGAALTGMSGSPLAISIGMLSIGAGWGIGFGAATIGLHEGRPSAGRLALFDGLMLGAALAGVLGAAAI
ncbi:hypothetical protein IZ6_30140 [Terrihabitans soli]|uniref:MFS transporter n=1 Tax=Terrihabitans soli TaxID=708113 RepID=A0A6S6QT56_9HYPH|nr:hypothetical protein [Terrihabitans soli]BCJ92279.1 hypothetical protein IZ6_30140 [Terrihabitans soli]